jgi:Flp pilus assembly protein TadG
VRVPQIWRNREGAAAVEFALTAPAFFAMLVGVIECGLLLWTQIGLQHGAEMAARCASINTTLCGTTSAIQQYAAQQAFGLNPPSSTFTADPSPASGCGYKVSASYAFNFLTEYFPSQTVTISAQSCFPK